MSMNIFIIFYNNIYLQQKSLRKFNKIPITENLEYNKTPCVKELPHYDKPQFHLFYIVEIVIYSL